MSGLEIAGLAVGVIPLILYAADQYKSRRLDPKLGEFFQNLSFEIGFLLFNIRRLAGSLEGISDEMRERLSSPQSPQDLEKQWSSPEVAQALKTRLGHGHEMLFSTLESILDLLEKLIDDKPLRLTNHEAVSALLTVSEWGSQSSRYPRLTLTRNSVPYGTNLGQTMIYEVAFDLPFKDRIIEYLRN